MRQLSFIRAVGAGAFGAVYQAELLSGRGFRRQVAVKVIHARGPDGAMFLARIRDEARLLGLLQDDAILKVLDMVQVEGRDAVVMEYIEGVDLDSIIEAAQAPPPRALAELGATVAGALHRAHTAVHPADGVPLGVVHRDVKPANIMVTRSGGVRLLDFGVARAEFEARESRTGQLILGTLNYLAPEYIVANQLSPSADVFGLALSLYEACTGQVYGQPKVRQDAHERRLEERLAALAGWPAMQAALRRMLAWAPEQRPDAGQAERLLWDVAQGTPGEGLRQWAAQAVPRVLEARGAPEDALGLAGRVIDLGDDGPGEAQRAADEGPWAAPEALRSSGDRPRLVEPEGIPDPAAEVAPALPSPARPAARPPASPAAPPRSAEPPAVRPAAPLVPAGPPIPTGATMRSATPAPAPPPVPTAAPATAPPTAPATAPPTAPAIPVVHAISPAGAPADPRPACAAPDDTARLLVKGVLLGVTLGAVLLAVVVGALALYTL